jgi:hypothetical protein
MFGGISSGWKLALTVGLMVAILGSISVRPPGRPVARHELRRVVLAALLLYAVGAVASMLHRGQLAGIVYAAGIFVGSLAVWLSRGSDRGDGPDGPGGDEPPQDRYPPVGPDGVPLFDWEEFDRERAIWGRARAGYSLISDSSSSCSRDSPDSSG